MKYAATCALSFALSAPVAAQFDLQWANFVEDPTMLELGIVVSDSDNETDLAWADADQDGWTDLVVVRKEPFTSSGKRTNLFLHNEFGILIDRTTDYASSSSTPIDSGFLTATNDRDVVFVDVDGDGWEDMVTATTISLSAPKHVGHPRVYYNLGPDSLGAWAGFRYDVNRIPQLYHADFGWPLNPRFCSVAAGDLTFDGAPDLYFGDYDSSGAGGDIQPPQSDLNDRLLVNGGTGWFTDESGLRMSKDMLESAFGMAVEIHDVNADGYNDVLKDTALQPPQDVRAIYNNPSSPGTFLIQDKFHADAPYHIDVNDINNDGRPDIVISDDVLDRYRYNVGVDALGRVIWSPAMVFGFLSGGDDGFASNNLIADLDGDGWRDVLVCDVDVDIYGYTRRLHIYHNPGGTPGDPIVLREERQSASSGWVGAPGFSPSDLTATHDVAPIDIDNDGDTDLVISRRDGTQVWRNETPAKPPYCQQDIGHGGPGGATLTMCGDPMWPGGVADLVVDSGGLAGAPAFLVVGFLNQPIPVFGGMLVPSDLALVQAITMDAQGRWSQSVIANSPNKQVCYVQAAVIDLTLPQALAFTNALEVTILPQ